MFTVTCPAEVIERKDGYFLLDTPIIGLAQCFLKNCPRNMSVGDIWNVNMHRQKDKKGTLDFLFDKYQVHFPCLLNTRFYNNAIEDLPSHWVAHSLEGDLSRPSSEISSGRKEMGRLEEKNEIASISSDQMEDDQEWGTVCFASSFRVTHCVI